MDLTELGFKYGTDKASVHQFTKIYDEYFKPIKQEKLKLLEVGVLIGSSLKMWEQYFSNSTIYGADIFTEEERNALKQTEENIRFGDLSFEDRTFIFIADQEKIEDLLLLPKNLDIIIDDGGHTMFQQQLTCKTLFSNINPNGTYILEDLHTSHYPNYGATETNNTLRFLEDLQSGILSKDNDYYVTEEEFKTLFDDIDFIKIYKVKEGSITSIIQKK